MLGKTSGCSRNKATNKKRFSTSIWTPPKLISRLPCRVLEWFRCQHKLQKKPWMAKISATFPMVQTLQNRHRKLPDIPKRRPVKSVCMPKHTSKKKKSGLRKSYASIDQCSRKGWRHGRSHLIQHGARFTSVPSKACWIPVSFGSQWSYLQTC